MTETFAKTTNLEIKCVLPENVHTPRMKSFCVLTLPPLRKFQLSFILSLKLIGFCDLYPSPPLLEFSMTFLGVGTDIRNIRYRTLFCGHTLKNEA